MKARFIVEREDSSRMIISDVGSTSMSITNDAEAVVHELHKQGLGKRKLFYYDSEGKLDELLHDGKGNFIGFGLYQ